MTPENDQSMSICAKYTFHIMQNTHKQVKETIVQVHKLYKSNPKHFTIKILSQKIFHRQTFTHTFHS